MVVGGGRGGHGPPEKSEEPDTKSCSTLFYSEAGNLDIINEFKGPSACMKHQCY